MLHRTLLGAALLGLVGLPYVLSTQKEQPRAPEAGLENLGLTGMPPARIESSPRLPAMPPMADAPKAAVGYATPALVDTRAIAAPGQAVRPAETSATPASLEDIFRFELTPEQIVGTWPMVNTTTNQAELKGYRVALVTGNRPESLAGSLTYYFNGEQQLQRIVFHGTTGEPRPLVQLVSRKFDFKSDAAADVGTQRYVVRWSGKIVSEMRVQPAQVIDAGQPHRRFSINLLIERPQKLRWFTGGGSSTSGLRL
jgi:hypothetical protein